MAEKHAHEGDSDSEAAGPSVPLPGQGSDDEGMAARPLRLQSDAPFAVLLDHCWLAGRPLLCRAQVPELMFAPDAGPLPAPEEPKAALPKKKKRGLDAGVLFMQGA